MKKLILFALIIVHTTISAQEKQLALNDLFIPDAPGLILGDRAPSSVSKPTTSRAFAAGIFNLAQGGAIEVTPYWLYHHPNLDYYAWINKRFTLLQTFNISVATYRKDKIFALAPGFRTQVIRSFDKRIIKEMMLIKKKHQDILLNDPTNFSALNKLVDQADSMSKKGFFSVELASAILGLTPDNSIKNLDFNKSGVWTNIRWEPSGFPLGIVGLARYAWNGKQNGLQDTTSIDLGTGINFTKDKIDLSAEYIHRRETGGKINERLAFIVNFALNENISLVGSFGKDLSGTENLLTVLGVRIGLSNKKQL